MLSWFLPRKTTPKAAAAADVSSVLRRNVWQYRWLDGAQRAHVEEVVRRMTLSRRWEGAGGLVVTDEMSVTVSGVAALLTLGYDEPYAFDELPSIVIYPAAFETRREGGGGWLDLAPDSEAGEARLGEAWRRGPVVLSWSDALRSARRPQQGDNLVLHEFAHHVDGLDGDMDGTPGVRGPLRQRWEVVAEREFARLVAQSRRGDVTLLDHYGASNQAEFFAVATECFFERAHEMRERHGELYALLAEFYRQDPTEWLPPPNRLSARRDAAMQQGPARVDVSGLGLSPADSLFTAAHEWLAAREFEKAIAALDKLLALEPEDAEALMLRAAAHLETGDYESARDDAVASVAIEPDEAVAQAAAAEALWELGEDEAAMRHAKTACRVDAKNPEGWLLRGLLALRAGRVGEATRALRRASQLDPYDADTFYWLGCAREQAGDTKAARRHFERSRVLDAEVVKPGGCGCS